MPVTALQLAPAIQAQLNSQGLVGSFVTNLASGVGIGIQNFVQTLVVQAQAFGTLGAGEGTGKWTLDPLSGMQILDTNIMASALPGTDKSKIANGVAFGTAQVINSSAVVQTAVAGVAVGSETGAVINADPTAATSFIYSGLTSYGIVGPKAANLASGLGQGIAIWFASGVVTNAVVGSPVFPFNPTTGLGTGKIT
jgi:hypothetical protein